MLMNASDPRTRRFGVALLLMFAAVVRPAPVQAQDTAELRVTQPLPQDWRFLLDDDLSDDEALASDAAEWEVVTLPHTWNAEDAASLQATRYERGLGWYRIEFATPQSGTTHWLEFGAASLVADVWLNGRHLGQHKGGFTIFRFDVTDVLAPGGQNVLLVKADNRNPKAPDEPTAIAPLGGDFNISGGLYRHVSLISTPEAVHFDLADLGGPGVYATTTGLEPGLATVNVRARISNDASEAGAFAVRISLLDADGHLAATGEQPVNVSAGGRQDAMMDLEVANPRLWQGVTDPHLYRLVADLVSADGGVVDRVVQSIGIRQFHFDPEQGTFLNGQRLGRLNGVAIHQDMLGKAWAVSNEDVDASLAIVREIGATAVRLGHYPFNLYTVQRLSEMGLVAWAETPLGLRTVVGECGDDPTAEYVENAKLQLRELIRQQYNLAAVAMWSVGNETEAQQSRCPDPRDNVTPVIRELHEVAMAEDPTRATVYAEFSEDVRGSHPFPIGGITDLLATNRYYLWYNPAFDTFRPLLDALRARYPGQPVAVSEYGAGAALTHHTDNPQGGPPEVRSAPEGQTAFQPEEYAAFVHAQAYSVIADTPYLWGSFIWNLFDFGSAHRNEGDVLGVNTKGIVTFDRQTRKDPFYFHKANWAAEPVTWIVGRRYTDRVYPVYDVTVFSNADSVDLAVNGTTVGSMTAEQCRNRTCVFEDVALVEGANTITTTGIHAGTPVTDAVEWNYTNNGINIAAGRLATGLQVSDGTRFGSDHLFTGGTGEYIEVGKDAKGGVPEDIEGTDDRELFKFFRRGEFRYDIPLADGTYEVTLGFLDPGEKDAPARVFDVLANGERLLSSFDPGARAGKKRRALTRSFTVAVTGGTLVLDFVPVEGEALVSFIQVHPVQ